MELIGHWADAKGFATEALKKNFITEKTEKYVFTQLSITQMRIENLDDIFQKQLIWSYGKIVNGKGIDDAYFYWDWCPSGSGQPANPKWQIVEWDEFQYNLGRDIDRSFNYKDFIGVTNTTTRDQMPIEYRATSDNHA